MIPTSGFKKFRARFLQRMAAQGTDILMEWETLTDVSIDGPTGARIGTPTVQSETVKGFIHFPDFSTRTVNLYAEIEMGDCIVDLHPDVVIEGRDKLTLTINGEKWQQKKIGTQLARMWDTVFENARFCRTLLLRKAT